MIIVLLFLLVIVVIAARWLSHQRLMSQPWLEVGLGEFTEGRDRTSLSGAKLGLFVFLAVVGGFFALLVSGYTMRMGGQDWRSVALPPVLWYNTALLILGSAALQMAVRAARQSDADGADNTEKIRLWLGLGGLATIGFLSGQALAWWQLAGAGLGLTGNPANSFFYMLTGIHGLHILGGLLAWARALMAARRAEDPPRLLQRIELSALYWHFLLFIWLLLMGMLTGGQML
jgi:cytochrome c oxidase subunit III